ncbi:unnamed protein product [Effrenium voratum]|nr:unnamed protein product [Effrenium voratum]
MFDFDEIEEKLQQARAFDGDWHDGEGTVVTIKGTRMRGADGAEVEVSFPRAGTIAFGDGAEGFEGKLEADRIRWSDGASWVRKATGAPIPSAPPTSQSKSAGLQPRERAEPARVPPQRVPAVPASAGSTTAKQEADAGVKKPSSYAPEPSRPAKAAVAAKAAPKSASGPQERQQADSSGQRSEAQGRAAWRERFEVMRPLVFVRECPGLNAAKVAQVSRGCMVSGEVENGWLCLDSESRITANVPETAAGAYMLIDGRNHGLGLLLQSRGCHGSGRDSLAKPLEFVALTNLRMRAKPDPRSSSGAVVVQGATVEGFPGAGFWLEVVGGGFLPITSAAEDHLAEEVKDFLELRGALQPLVPQAFAEAILVRWEPLPLLPATRVEYSLEWHDQEERARRGRVSAARRCSAHLRSLPPAVPLRVRLVAQVFAPLPGGTSAARVKEDPTSRSWQDQRLVGRWLYGAKPSEYRIGRRTDGSLIFVGPHASGTVMGALEPEGHWLQAELAAASGDIVGHIRLFYDEQEDGVISNFKNIQSPDWGRDIIAKKGGDEEVLTTLVGQWVPVSTAPPITHVEEEENCYDPLCNRRGKCQKCSCQIFIMSEHLLGQELEDICCRRCGCSVAHHAKVGKYRLNVNGRVTEETHAPPPRPSPGAAPKSPMDEIPSRLWSVDAADEDPVDFIIKQLELAKNLYEVLGVPPSASALEIRQAYRAISLRVHPDKISGMPEAAALAEDAFKLASSAYEVLSDEVERKSYDRELRAEFVRLAKPKPKPKPKPRAQPIAKQEPAPVQKMPAFWDTADGEGDTGRGVDEFFKFCRVLRGLRWFLGNPTIGTFMNSPYYGEDGVFGTSGTIKENAAGGFSFELPGGGGIHIDSGNGFQRLKQMEDEMAKTGHIPPHMWPQHLFPQATHGFSVNTSPAFVGMQQWEEAKAKAKAEAKPAEAKAKAAEPRSQGQAPRFIGQGQVPGRR